MRFAAVFVLSIVALTATGCDKKVDEPATTEFTPSKPPPVEGGVTTLQKVDTVVGKGVEAKTGDKVKVNYTGTLLDGTQFDSSIGREPFEFEIGKGQVIKGWDDGVPGMKVGGKRTLTIPSSLGYGENGSGEKIPPNATLKFDIDLLSVNGDADAGAPTPKIDAGTININGKTLRK